MRGSTRIRDPDYLLTETIRRGMKHYVGASRGGSVAETAVGTHLGEEVRPGGGESTGASWGDPGSSHGTHAGQMVGPGVDQGSREKRWLQVCIQGSSTQDQLKPGCVCVCVCV